MSQHLAVQVKRRPAINRNSQKVNQHAHLVITHARRWMHAKLSGKPKHVVAENFVKVNNNIASNQPMQTAPRHILLTLVKVTPVGRLGEVEDEEKEKVMLQLPIHHTAAVTSQRTKHNNKILDGKAISRARGPNPVSLRSPLHQPPGINAGKAETSPAEIQQTHGGTDIHGTTIVAEWEFLLPDVILQAQPACFSQRSTGGGESRTCLRGILVYTCHDLGDFNPGYLINTLEQSTSAYREICHYEPNHLVNKQ